MKVKKISLKDENGKYIINKKLSSRFNMISSEDSASLYFATVTKLQYPIKRKEHDVLSRIVITTELDNVMPSDIAKANEVMLSHVFDKDIDYSKKLLKYKKKTDYYTDKDLERVIDSFLETKVFRSFLCRFIKYHQTFCLSEEKKIDIIISSEGEFKAVQRGNISQKVNLSLSEQSLFNFYCFIELNRFWDEAMELQSLNQSKSPLLILDGFGKINPELDSLEIVIKYAKTIKHQIIFFDSYTSLQSIMVQ